MPGRMRRKQHEFIPVVMIPEHERTPADFAAIRHLHTLHGIIMSTMDTERSRKLEIGISEIASDCRKCVARKLSMQYPKRNEGGAGWFAQVGTMGHDYLERFFKAKYPWMFEDYEVDDPDNPGSYLWKTRTIEGLEPTLEQPIYHLERKLKVWEYEATVDGAPYKIVLDGSCDLFSYVMLPSGEIIGVVTDWKFQGQRKLAETGKGKIGSTYHGQMSTYGLGYELAGFDVTHLDLHAIPRDGNLDESRPVLFRYNRQDAIDAIAGVKALIDAAALLGWRTVIESAPNAAGCFDCDWFESIEEADFVTQLTA